ncbi:MAG: hypothetical protein MUO91_03615 [candidate division Zixibacteria bacterium]|nr:hypothetical protein [candidate division Zixibacteria bacterium]
MKVKAILFGLILMAILFCTANHNQAHVGPNYSFDTLSYPSEHPWQHNHSYVPSDSSTYRATHIMILPICPGIKAILLIQNASDTKGLSCAPGGLKNNHIQNVDSRKSR